MVRPRETSRKRRGPRKTPTGSVDGVPPYPYTPMERKFIAAYIANPRSFAGAARAAGYKWANFQGWVIGNKPHIAAAIAGAQAAAAARLEITAEHILSEIACIAFSDLRQLYDENGNLLPVPELDDATAAALSGIDVTSVANRDGVVETTKKIRLWNKHDALKALGAHMKIQLEQLALTLSGPGGGPIAISQETNDERALRTQQQLLSEL